MAQVERRRAPGHRDAWHAYLAGVAAELDGILAAAFSLRRRREDSLAFDRAWAHTFFHHPPSKGIEWPASSRRKSTEKDGFSSRIRSPVCSTHCAKSWG